MALIDIEYGSLASSEIMNKNFLFLDNKISETSDTIMTTISSILSNIATINTRLNDLSEEINSSLKSLSSNLDEYKTKTKILVNKANMVPKWSACAEITLPVNNEYTITSNGYLLLKATSSASGTLTVNNNEIILKTRNSSYDNAAELIVIPVYEDDIVKTSVALEKAYFLPTIEISIENF